MKQIALGLDRIGVLLLTVFLFLAAVIGVQYGWVALLLFVVGAFIAGHGMMRYTRALFEAELIELLRDFAPERDALDL